MILKENENSIITKEYNDPIERYLKNIIQRYFQIENKISQETKEGIIIQAYTRLKEIFNAYNSHFIICINEESGAIDLSISNLGGEKSFEKESAFNKDFCDVRTETKTLYNNTTETYTHYGIEEPDKIVEGNDDRLSDARIPLYHTHTVDDIIGLEEAVNNYILSNGILHLHNNLDVLEILIYTGSRTSIDLILLEDIIIKVEKEIDFLKDINDKFVNDAKRIQNQIINVLIPIRNKVSTINTDIDKLIADAFNSVNEYDANKISSFQNEVKNYLKDFLTLEEYNNLKRAIEKAITLAYEGSFNVGAIDFSIDKINKRFTNEDENGIKHGHTEVVSNVKESTRISDASLLSKFHNSKINNALCKLFLSYTKDGVEYKDKLPHLYTLNDSPHDCVLVFGNTDSDNNINIYERRLSTIPVYLYSNVTAHINTEDNAKRTSDDAFVVFENGSENIDGITNNQDYTTLPTSANVYTSTFNNNPLVFSATHNGYVEQSQIELQKIRYVKDTKTIYHETIKNISDVVITNAPYSRTYKKIAEFIPNEDYNGDFTVTMNSGHWDGFAFYEIPIDAPNVPETELPSTGCLFNNIYYPHGSHESGEYSITEENVELKKDTRYAVYTKECDVGGTGADSFVYNFKTNGEGFQIKLLEPLEQREYAKKETYTEYVDNKNATKCTIVWDYPTNDYAYRVLRKYEEESWEYISPYIEDMEYYDVVYDNYNPNTPSVSVTYLEETSEYYKYQFDIHYTDVFEKVEYKLEVYPKSVIESSVLDANFIDPSPTFTTGIIKIQCNAGIKKLNARITLNNSNTNCNILSEQQVNPNHKKITIAASKFIGDSNNIYFLDETMFDSYNNIQDYVSEYNCSLANVTSSNLSTFNSIVDTKNEYFVGNNKKISEETLVNVSEYDYCNYIGQLKLESLSDFLTNAKVIYQLFKVPGKGEN